MKNIDPYISLPCTSTHKKGKKLYNLPSDFEQTFDGEWLDDFDFSSFQRNIISQAPSDHLKIFYSLLTARKFGEEIQGKNRLLRYE